MIIFLPIPRGTYKDGGIKDYCALTYRIILWNRSTDDSGRNASEGELTTYHNTSVFWFPANFKSIDELWEIESSGSKMINDFTYTENQPVKADDLREKYNILFSVLHFRLNVN